MPSKTMRRLLRFHSRIAHNLRQPPDRHTLFTEEAEMTIAEPSKEAADELRTVDQLMLPDVRMRSLCVRQGATIRPLSQSDRHGSISALTLGSHVPENIRVHFDTARNLYLYAWFVYRFHVVAEQHALSTLEFALRTALADAGRPIKNDTRALQRSRSKTAKGLRQLLDQAVERGLISNERLPLRNKWTSSVAEHRISLEQMAYMREQGLNQMTFPVVKPIPTKEELEIDWVGRFRKALPAARNDYAHGSSTLHATVFRTFEVVWSLVDQLFPSTPLEEHRSEGAHKKL